MLENESNHKLSNQRLSRTENGDEKDFLKIRRLHLKNKRGVTLLAINLDVDMFMESPAVVRIPARAAWRAIGLIAHSLGLEVDIDLED